MTDIIYADSWKTLIDFQLKENPARINSWEKAELEENLECNELKNNKVNSEFYLYIREGPWICYLT